jgi:hypothetical protein
MPFLYIAALIGAYEKLFVRLDFFLKNNKALANFAKQKIFYFCFLNLWKLNKFAKERALDFLDIKNKSDVLKMVKTFNNRN